MNFLLYTTFMSMIIQTDDKEQAVSSPVMWRFKMETLKNNLSA